MAERRSPKPARLREIRRLARNAEVAETWEPVTAARKRRLFGPLLYSTLAFSALCLLYLWVLRAAEWANRETHRATEVTPEKELATALAGLDAKTWQARVEGAKALGYLVRRYGPGDDWSVQRGAVVSALQKALSDQDGPMRAAAADALGSSPQAARAAKNELIAALNDQDITVRLSAAGALLTAGGDSEGPALRALADMVVDTIPGPEHVASLRMMVDAGKAGNRAAALAFALRLSDVDEPAPDQEISAASLLELEMLLPALEPLFKSDDPRRRTAAALAVASAFAGEPIGTTGRSNSSPAPVQIVWPLPYRFANTVTILEQAVTNTALELDLRESALTALVSIAAVRPLHRCGLALVRQLDHPDETIRLNAAKLLRRIDPSIVAGINIPEETP
jgi:hypothetical protein